MLGDSISFADLSVEISSRYSPNPQSTAATQEFFLLAGFTVCGGDSFSFADLSAEGASSSYLVSDRD